MKRLLFSGLLVLCAAMIQSGKGQSLAQIQWQRSFGGTNHDHLLSLRETPAGGFVLAGFSNSDTNGNKTSPNYGRYDYWLIRLDANGQELWQASFGGTNTDRAYAVATTMDGGFILGGESFSGLTGNKTSPNFGGSDYWVLRLDANGGKLWECSFGGSSNDVLSSLHETSDGGVILGGWSSSRVGGNKTSTNFGLTDVWLVRLDQDGNKLWERSYGGNDAETGVTIALTSDDGFVFSTVSRSGASGNKTNAPSGTWVVRLDSGGNKLWERTVFWGPGWQFPPDKTTVQAIANSEFLVGSSVSYDCCGGVPCYCSDVYLARLDTAGNQIFSRWLPRMTQTGGPPPPLLAAVRQTADGGFVTGYHGADYPWSSGYPYLIYRLDSLGNVIWAQEFGSYAYFASQTLYSIETTRDGGIILGGESAMPVSGNKTSPNFGWPDYWVVKLYPEQPHLELLPATNAREKVHFLLQTSYFATYAIERSTNLVDWQPWQTNAFTGTTLEFVDRDTNQISKLFYRARRLP